MTILRVNATTTEAVATTLVGMVNMRLLEPRVRCDTLGASAILALLAAAPPTRIAPALTNSALLALTPPRTRMRMMIRNSDSDAPRYGENVDVTYAHCWP